MTRRTLNWNSALRSLRADHDVPRPVREEGSRFSTSGLSSWRGRSGRRYVIRINPDLDAAEAAVVIAVARDPAGRASILTVGLAPSFVPPAGTGELHVHRLAETDEDRAAVVADLSPMTPADAIAALLAFYSEPGVWTSRGEGDLESVIYKVCGDSDEAGISEVEWRRRSDLIHGVFAACGCDLATLADVVEDERAVVAVLRVGLG